MPAAKNPDHGTYAKYRDKKCRCTRCRMANANYKKALKDAKKLLTQKSK